MRGPSSSVFWTSCAWSSSGRHRFEEGKSEFIREQRGGPYGFCSLCGAIVAAGDMPKHAVSPDSATGDGVGIHLAQFCLDRDGDGCFYCGALFVEIVQARFMPDRFAPPDPDANGSPDPALQRPLNPPELTDGKSVDEAEDAA